MPLYHDRDWNTTTEVVEELGRPGAPAARLRIIPPRAESKNHEDGRHVYKDLNKKTVNSTHQNNLPSASTLS